MGYWVLDDDERYDDIRDLCTVLFNPDNYEPNNEHVREYINSTYEDCFVTIGDTEFSPAEIVENCDNRLWRTFEGECAENMADSDQEYYSGMLYNMGNGDVEYINVYKIEYFEEDDENKEETASEKPDFYADNEEHMDEEEEQEIRSLLDAFQHISG